MTSRSPASIDTYLPRSADRLRRLFTRLDPDFADLWATHLSRLLARDQLDLRSRFLVLTAQYTVTERTAQLEETLDAALSARIRAGELLEVILQAYVYTGPWVVSGACEAFERVMAARGDDLPPAAAAHGAERRLDTEQDIWSDQDRIDPRLGSLLERYGWRGISNGLRLRPGHHINMVASLDALDPDFLAAWLDAVYDGMYGRGVLDDRTRLLCVVGATLALGETHQSRRHMRAAMRNGAAPREVLEVIFQTTAFFGHPYVMPAAFDDLIQIADDEGRIAELIEPDRVADVKRIVAARVARRAGVQDGIA